MSIENVDERLASIIERLDNILALQKAPTLPDAMRIDSLTGLARDTRRDIFALYTEIGGEDHWGDAS